MYDADDTDTGGRDAPDPSSGAATGRVPVTVRTGDGEATIRVPRGATLRDELLDAGFDVYGPLSRRLNCGGRGLCATCGVCLAGGAPPPDHWHDRLAVTFGYPRLSCQVTVDGPLTVTLVDKLYWGQVLPRRYDPDAERADAGVCQDTARSASVGETETETESAGDGTGTGHDGSE